jgi:hypothetical protein
MIKLQKQVVSGSWTKKKIFEEALKYNRPSDWAKNSGGSYGASVKNGWLRECCAHMTIRKTKPDRFWWDKNNCITDALKYKSKSEWFNNNATAVASAKKMGWYDECIIPYYGYIEEELVQTYYKLNEELKTSNNEKDWLIKNKKSYLLAKKLDLYDLLIVKFSDNELTKNFNDFKSKILELIDFDKHSKTKDKVLFKRDMRIKTSEIILLCDDLIKNSYE